MARCQGYAHVRGAPYHLQAQGRIERQNEEGHQTLKSLVLLGNYYLPGNLEAQIDLFIAHYNYHRYHENLNNLTPADVYFGRRQEILEGRRCIKRQPLEYRRFLHRKTVA